jgi:hypothetical protein
MAEKGQAMIELTQEQRRELDHPGPVRVRDPQTNETYVLVPTQVYERIERLVSQDEGWSHDAYLAAMEVFAREGWDDPRMDAYDALDPRRPS